MTTLISLFNHKGGVSKTTTAFNLGWAIAETGRSVLIVDGDPQCNLTGMALGFGGVNDFEDFYTNSPDKNLCAALLPTFAGKPQQLKPAPTVPTLHPNLSLLPGHIDLAAYEAQLAVAFSAGTALPGLRNMPGAVGHLLRITADEFGFDVVLVDMSPSIGSLNQSLFLVSDYFVVPTSPDYFCYIAINSLAKVLPNWTDSVAHLRGTSVGLSYPLPSTGPKFLGIISQRYRPRSGNPAAAFQAWIDRIKDVVRTGLVPELEKRSMSIGAKEFASAVSADTPFNLANVPDFNSLIAKSQAKQTPVFALTERQIDEVGRVLQQMVKNRDLFAEVFEELAESVCRLAKV